MRSFLSLLCFLRVPMLRERRIADCVAESVCDYSWLGGCVCGEWAFVRRVVSEKPALV